MKKAMKAEYYSKLEPFLIEMDNIVSDHLCSLECDWIYLKPFDFELIVNVLRSKMPLHFYL